MRSCGPGPGRELALQSRAAEWFEATGNARARGTLLSGGPGQADRALEIAMQAQVVPDFLHVPTTPLPLALDVGDPSMLAETPERLLGLAADLLLAGDTARGGDYLDLLDQAGRFPAHSRLAARFAAFQSFRYGVGRRAGKVGADGAGRAGYPRAGAAHRRMEHGSSAGPHPRVYLPRRLPGGRARGSPRLWPNQTSPTRSSSCWCQVRARWPGWTSATWPRPPSWPGRPRPMRGGSDLTQHFFAVDYLRTLGEPHPARLGPRRRAWSPSKCSLSPNSAAPL